MPAYSVPSCSQTTVMLSQWADAAIVMVPESTALALSRGEVRRSSKRMMGCPESPLTTDSHFRTRKDLVTHAIPPVTIKLTHVGKWGLIDRILL